MSRVAFLVAFVCLAPVATAKVLAPPLQITKAEKIVELHHRVAMVTTSATFAFRGSPKDVHALVFSLPKGQASRVSQVEVSYKTPGADDAHLSAARLRWSSDPSHAHFLIYSPASFEPDHDPRVCLEEGAGLDQALGCAYDNASASSPPLMSEASPTLRLSFSYFLGHPYVPLPKSVRMKDTPAVVFEETRYFQSVYTVQEQITKVVLRGQPRIERIVALAETERSVERAGSSQEFSSGPFLDAPPLFEPASSLALHFRHNRHLGYVASAHKLVDIADGGTIRVHEKFVAVNEAATLKGEFARQEISDLLGTLMGRIRREGHRIPESPVLFEMTALLPATAYHLDFYDAIGNISSSNARRETVNGGARRAHVTFEPRYPLLGGWKADWALEYKAPFSSMVNAVPNEAGVTRQAQFALDLPVSPAFKSLWYDRTEVEVLLPAGASDVHVHSEVVPDEVVIRDADRWLDRLFKRKRVLLNFSNVIIPEKRLLSATFQIHYRYSPVASFASVPMWRCLLSVALLAVFGIVRRFSLDVHTQLETDMERRQREADRFRVATADELEDLERTACGCVRQMERAHGTLKGDNLKERLHHIEHSWRAASASKSFKLKQLSDAATPPPDAEPLPRAPPEEVLRASQDWIAAVDALLAALVEDPKGGVTDAVTAEKLRASLVVALSVGRVGAKAHKE